uniref:Uncharacterized protein n=1 Tax=Lygus hesperus TaxID=30085 RepID=A0A0A9XRR9_LYGHE
MDPHTLLPFLHDVPPHTVQLERRVEFTWVPRTLPISLRNVASAQSKQFLRLGCGNLWRQLRLGWALHCDVGLVPTAKLPQQATSMLRPRTLELLLADAALWNKHSLIVPAHAGRSHVPTSHNSIELDPWCRTRQPMFVGASWSSVLLACRATVRRTSLQQTIKGILTAGPVKSLRYLLHKLLR